MPLCDALRAAVSHGRRQLSRADASPTESQGGITLAHDPSHVGFLPKERPSLYLVDDTGNEDEAGIDRSPLPAPGPSPASPGAQVGRRLPSLAIPPVSRPEDASFGDDAHSVSSSSAGRRSDRSSASDGSCGPAGPSGHTSSFGSPPSPGPAVSFAGDALARGSSDLSRSSSGASSAAGRMCGAAVSVRRVRSRRSATPGLMRAAGLDSPRTAESL